MVRILGIDPGSRITGYGIIDIIDRNISYVSSGCIKTRKTNISDKLHDIFNGISQVVKIYKVNEAAIEEVFFHKNAVAALKLGQARGAAIVSAAIYGCEIFEYYPRIIKQAVSGYGAASKDQVSAMVLKLLKLKGDLQVDSADALAIALCHAYSRQNIKIVK